MKKALQGIKKKINLVGTEKDGKFGQKTIQRFMNIIENIQKYIQTQIELSKLEVQDQLEAAFKRIAMLLVLILSGVFMLAFLLITLAIGINRLFDSSWIGFLITALLWILPIWFCVKSLKDEL